MKIPLFLALVFGTAAMASAQADSVVALDAGQTVTLTIGPGGAVTAADGGVATLTDFDRAALQALVGAPVEAASGSNAIPLGDKDGLPQPPPIAPGAVRILFVRLANGNALLVLENGYPQGLAYRARIRGGSRAGPTDVCTVLPSRRGYEHWEFRIDRIELSAFRLEPWREGQAPRCE